MVLVVTAAIIKSIVTQFFEHEGTCIFLSCFHSIFVLVQLIPFVLIKPKSRWFSRIQQADFIHGFVRKSVISSFTITVFQGFGANYYSCFVCVWDRSICYAAIIAASLYFEACSITNCITKEGKSTKRLQLYPAACNEFRKNNKVALLVTRHNYRCHADFSK